MFFNRVKISEGLVVFLFSFSLLAIALPQFDKIKRLNYDLNAKDYLKKAVENQLEEFEKNQSFKPCFNQECVNLFSELKNKPKNVNISMNFKEKDFYIVSYSKNGSGKTFYWDSGNMKFSESN